MASLSAAFRLRLFASGTTMSYHRGRYGFWYGGAPTNREKAKFPKFIPTSKRAQHSERIFNDHCEMSGEHIVRQKCLNKVIPKCTNRPNSSPLLSRGCSAPNDPVEAIIPRLSTDPRLSPADQLGEAGRRGGEWERSSFEKAFQRYLTGAPTSGANESNLFHGNPSPRQAHS